jgi:hypothetical protein
VFAHIRRVSEAIPMRPSTYLVRILALSSLLLVALASGPALEEFPVAAALAASGGCALPVTHDSNAGFHIGVPAGWDLFTLNGTISVTKDASGTEQSIVYPALLTKGLTPSAFFKAYTQNFQKATKASGNNVTFHKTSHGGQLPSASLTGRAGKVAVSGRASVVILPDRTAHGSSLIAFVAYWAPTAKLAGQRTALAAIGKCYGPQAGTLYRIAEDQVFTYGIPSGWNVTGESQDTLDIDNANHTASAHYALTLVSATEANSPPTLLAWIFRQLNVTVTHVISSVRLPDVSTSNGGVAGQEYLEFTGRLPNGTAIHGLVHVVSVTGNGFTSGVMRLGISTPGLWNSVNGTLLHIIGSIQHDFTQDLQQWENINQQWQQENRNFQGFDDALTGVDLVHDPSTGGNFEAPYNSYEPNGPDGPGYYNNATTPPTLLKIITP